MSALPAATMLMASFTPAGDWISTSRPSSAKYPFSCASYRNACRAFGYQSSTTVRCCRSSLPLFAASDCAAFCAPQPVSSMVPAARSARIRFFIYVFLLMLEQKFRFFLKLCYQVYKLLRQVIIFFSNQLTMPTAIIATTLSSTIGANTPAPSSCVIMRRLK